MKVLILGGTQFIGPAVVTRLHAAGHHLTVFHRGQAEADLPPDVDHLHADRHDLAAFADQFRTLLPDVVLDMAAYTERDAREVIDAFRGVARRLVVLSSQDVYRGYGRFHRKEAGPLEPVPFAEDAPLRETLYPYRGQGRDLDDYDKIPVERLITTIPELPATILRLPMVYGERDYQRRLFVELRRMDDGRPAVILEETFANWRWTRGYVSNIAAAIAIVVGDERAAGRVYNLGEAEARSYVEWLRAVGQAADWPGEVIVVPDGRLPPELRPPDGDYTQDLVADTGRIRNELGYIEPVPFFQGLLRAVAWERAARGAIAPLDYTSEDALLAELRSEQQLSTRPSDPLTAP